MTDDAHYYEPARGHGLPHDPFNAIVGPRPIGWVSTLGADGTRNLAPYSFFNCLSADPAIVAIGVENRADMSFKDTGRNVRMTEHFTVNIVDDAKIAAFSATIRKPSGKPPRADTAA